MKNDAKQEIFIYIFNGKFVTSQMNMHNGVILNVLSSTNKTDRQDIAEISLKEALNNISLSLICFIRNVCMLGNVY
jgi:hypothetical protein